MLAMNCTSQRRKESRYAALIAAAVIVCSISRGISIPLGAYNQDCYGAISVARYLLLENLGPGPIDLYTQGAVPPFLYLPFLLVVRLLDLYGPLQDDICMLALYITCMVSIVFLSDRIIRTNNDTSKAILLSVLLLPICLSGSSDMYSPNAELLGTPFLLYGYCALNCRKPKEYTLSWLFGLASLLICFFIKYQFILLIILVLIEHSKRQKNKGTLSCVFIISLLFCEAIMFRLQPGYGVIGNTADILREYSFRVASDHTGAGSSPPHAISSLLDWVRSKTILRPIAVILEAIRVLPLASIMALCLYFPKWLLGPLVLGRLRILRFDPWVTCSIASILPGSAHIFEHYILLLVPGIVIGAREALVLQHSQDND